MGICSFSDGLVEAEAVALPEFDDPNIDKTEAVAGVLGKPFPPTAIFLLIHSSEDDSPYPEVRSAVANTDDPDMPSATFRSWTLGLIWAIIVPVSFCSLS